MANLRESMYYNARIAKGTKRDNDTASTYKPGIKKFVKYMQEKYGINKIRDVYDSRQEYVQEFADWMRDEKNYAASTIKTYIAAVCQGLNMSMSGIKRDKVGAPTKGRSKEANPQGKKEAEKDRFATSVALSKATGLRRRELRKLTVGDFKQDESNHWCVVVRVGNGKGGKGQYQRILPENYQTVKAVFDAARRAYEASGYEDKVIDGLPLLAPDQTKNKINYHAFRRQNAQQVVSYYTDLAQTEAGRNRLIDELVMRWNACHSEAPLKKDRKGRARRNEKIKWDRDTGRYVPADDKSPAASFLDDIYRPGMYRIRGENLSRALCKGCATEYDRVALRAISVFHLSHWRDDVTIKHYILA